ncbi:MFS transporter [Leifsonia shinshuensis]|uniref:CynX/NimT family MFS transporter n=1 Tax=Leifsonia shinshuensis TaxID=150026 RepID=A0A7G6YD36_9MICO|nr:MFS transporter [Leifsonia shinshuensis]QNE36401.1 CynX/NimT family MFS transporter [Leifsonia shinshuensis]
MTVRAAVTPTRRARALSPALILVGLLLVAGNLRAGITTVGPVLADIERDLGLTSVAASVLVSLPLLAFAVVSPLAPRLARRVGLEWALGLGLIGLAAGLVLRSLPGLAWLWGGTALIGVAIAVLNVVLPALVKRDFPTRIGQITGSYSAVQSIFAALAAGVAVPVAGMSALGWRLPLGMWAVLAVVAFAVLAPQLRRRTIATPGQDDVSVTAHDLDGTRWRSPWRSALGWQVTAFMGMQSVGFYVFITWLPSIETAAGVGPGEAGLHQLFLNGFGIVGSIGCSFLIPRFRDQRLLAMIAPALIVVSAAGILVAPQLSGVWTSLTGVAGGASIVLALSFFGLRTSHHSQAAALSGMAQTVGYAFAAAGPIAVGALHDATGSWSPALAVVIVLQVLLVVVGGFAGRARVVG